MSSHSLTITYTGPAVPDNPYWLVMEEVPPTGTETTVQEAAEFLDKLFDRDPCVDGDGQEEDDGSGESLGLEDRDDAEITAAAQETLNPPACDQVLDGSYDAEIHIARSHQDEDYRLYVISAEVDKTEPVREMTRQTLAIDSATSIQLDKPVIGRFSAEWQGGVITASGSRPSILRNGNVLYWSEPATGTLTASYLTTYDKVTVHVPGLGSRSVEAKLVGVYHALVEELTTTAPTAAGQDLEFCNESASLEPTDAEITCYMSIAVSTRCQCSHEEIDWYTYDQEVPCPEWVARCPNGLQQCTALIGSDLVTKYVACDGDEYIPGRPDEAYAVADPDYYREVCCTNPPASLPQCVERITTYRGGQRIELGASYYRQLYGPRTKIVPVPPVGGVCGNHITRQIITSTCCEGVPPLVWDATLSPEVMTPNSTVIIGVTGGGRFSLQWQVIGEGFEFMASGSQEMTTRADQPQVRLSALVGACGTALVTVSDGCSTVAAYIRCTVGRWSGVDVGFWPDGLVQAGNLFLCSSYGYPYQPGFSSILTGRWWVGPFESSPGTSEVWTYKRESHYLGLWASDSNLSPVMVEAPGTGGEVRIPALVSNGSTGSCNRPDLGSVDGVYLYWYAPYMAVWEWVC